MALTQNRRTISEENPLPCPPLVKWSKNLSAAQRAGLRRGRGTRGSSPRAPVAKAGFFHCAAASSPERAALVHRVSTPMLDVPARTRAIQIRLVLQGPQHLPEDGGAIRQ